MNFEEFECKLSEDCPHCQFARATLAKELLIEWQKIENRRDTGENNFTDLLGSLVAFGEFLGETAKAEQCVGSEDCQRIHPEQGATVGNSDNRKDANLPAADIPDYTCVCGGDIVPYEREHDTETTPPYICSKCGEVFWGDEIPRKAKEATKTK